MTWIKVAAIAVLLIIASVLPALAQQVVSPKSVPKFEIYSEKELRLIQQMVDEGKQKWRTDPVNYAKFFMNFYYPDLRPFERDRLNTQMFPKKGRAIVQVFYCGKIHTIYLNKVYPTYPDSIWIIDKMILN